MWRLLKESVEGTAHRRTGAPCQDSCAGTATRPGQEDFLVLACADGAGSAELSGEGSARACQRFVELACEALQRGEAEALLTAEGLRGCLRQVHEALVLEALVVSIQTTSETSTRKAASMKRRWTWVLRR